MIAVDSQIRYSILRLLNQLQNFVDLSRSPFVPDQIELNLLDLLTNESTLNALDEVLPLAGRFQEKNPRFIDGENAKPRDGRNHSTLSSLSPSSPFSEMDTLSRSTPSSGLSFEIFTSFTGLSAREYRSGKRAVSTVIGEFTRWWTRFHSGSIRSTRSVDSLDSGEFVPRSFAFDSHPLD